GNGERELGDDQAEKRMAGYVDAFPEAVRAEEYGALVGEEAGEDLAAGAVQALAEQGDATRLQPGAKQAVDAAQRGVTREQRQGAAAEALGRVADQLRQGAVVRRVVVGRHIGGQNAERLLEEVVRRAEQHLVGPVK